MSVFVRVLPSPEKTEQIKELANLGWSTEVIVEKVFEQTSDPSGVYSKAVKAIVANPHLFDTDVDEVAVARALRGDAAVWESLTHYERREVMLVVHARYRREKDENAADRADLGPKFSRRGLYVSPNPCNPEWLQLLEPMTGWNSRRLGEEAKDFAEARVL